MSVRLTRTIPTSLCRAIDRVTLRKLGRETKERYFPTPEDGSSVGLYLGLKLVSNGSVAVFCGRKDTAVNVCAAAVDLFQRTDDFTKPVESSNLDEVAKLAALFATHIGADAPSTKAAELGIFPERAFRELSPQGIADVAAVRRDPHRHCYPRELVEAVFAATEGGRHEREIAAHYGIPERTVNNLLKAGTGLHFSRRRGGMGPRSSKDVFLTHARRHPGKTASDISSWMAARVGVQIGKQSLNVVARREGVRLAHPQGALRNGRDPKRVEAHIRNNPEHTVLDVQAWAREALGREIPTQALYHFAEQRGLCFASCFKLVGATAEALVAYVRANEQADIHQVVAWLEGELRTNVAIKTVRVYLWRRGLKTRKLPTGGAAPYEKALLAWIEANPDAEFAEARAWLKSELGLTAHPNTLHSFLDTHGIKLRPSKGGTRASYGPALSTWLAANPDAGFDAALAWLNAQPGAAVKRVSLRHFLERRGILLAGAPQPRRPQR